MSFLKNTIETSQMNVSLIIRDKETNIEKKYEYVQKSIQYDLNDLFSHSAQFIQDHIKNKTSKILPTLISDKEYKTFVKDNRKLKDIVVNKSAAQITRLLFDPIADFLHIELECLGTNKGIQLSTLIKKEDIKFEIKPVVNLKEQLIEHFIIVGIPLQEETKKDQEQSNFDNLKETIQNEILEFRSVIENTINEFNQTLDYYLDLSSLDDDEITQRSKTLCIDLLQQSFEDLIDEYLNLENSILHIISEDE